MTKVNIQEAKTHLSRLLERVQQGERIVIAKAGVPIAELTAVTRPDIVFGALADTWDIDYDAFDAADADIARMWEADLGVDA